MDPHLGWRWTEYIAAIMGFLALGLNVVFLEETYPPIVLVQKAKELRRRTKNWDIHAKQGEIEVDFREIVSKNFNRPLRLLFTEPIVLLLSIYVVHLRPVVPLPYSLPTCLPTKASHESRRWRLAILRVRTLLPMNSMQWSR